MSGEPAGRRVRHEVKLRLLTVKRVTQLTPKMRRVTLTGEALEGYTSAAYDDHSKIFFPAEGQQKPTLPTMGPGGPIHAEGSARPTARDFTPRRYDAAAQELDIDFALHGHGPASNWAAQAQPGQFLGVGGPRGSFVLVREFNWYLLVGDETGLPAIGRRLEELPPEAHVTAVIEVDSAAEEQTLRSPARADIRWVHRGNHRASDESALMRATQSLQFPAGEGYVWIAGEASVAKGLRQYLTGERGLPKTHVKAAAYWKQGSTAVHENYDD